MSAKATLYAHDWSELLSTVDLESGPAWLKDLRNRGKQEHERQGLPTPANEEWKYTPLKDLSQRRFTDKTDFGNPVIPETVPGSVRVVFVNGAFVPSLSDLSSCGTCRVISLTQAIAQEDETVRHYLGAIARLEEHTFAALSTALFTDGVLIHIPAHATVEKVIEIVHVTTADGAIVAPRVVIVAEEASRAKIVETYVGTGSEALVIPVTEVYVAKDSNIEHVRVQDESEKTTHIGLWQVRQEESSEYRSYNVCFGAALARLDLAIWLGGRHVVSRLDGVVVARGDQLMDNHTRLDHALPDGNSFEIYKQIVDDRATVVFNGRIFVHQDAQKTDAKQTNQALLLSRDATINSKPQLEIFADDVKCTHGATVGSIEDTPLFYMRTRGIPVAEAQAILVYAFAAEVIELITIADVRERLESRLFNKLGRA